MSLELLGKVLAGVFIAALFAVAQIVQASHPKLSKILSRLFLACLIILAVYLGWMLFTSGIFEDSLFR